MKQNVQRKPSLAGSRAPEGKEKFYILLLSTLLIFLGGMNTDVQAQTIQRCGTDALHDQMMATDADYAQRYEESLQMRLDVVENWDEYVSNRSAACPNGQVTVPVAVHFDVGIGTTPAEQACLENLVHSQIDVLNEAFNATNAPGCSQTPGAGACITFVLATLNHPAGTGLTNGDPAITYNGAYTCPAGSPCGIPTWNGYMNIAVQSNLGSNGVLGVSFLPGNPIGGANTFVVGSFGFGVNTINCNEAGPSSAPVGWQYVSGNTAVHEAGHWFGLPHTFCSDEGGTPQGGNDCSCTGNQNCDFINDTPDQCYSNYTCFSGTCSTPVTNPCGGTAVWNNFMDYLVDDCMTTFTDQQTTIMNNTADNGNFNLSAIDVTNEPTCDFVFVYQNQVIPDGGSITVCPGRGIQIYDASTPLGDSFDYTITGSGGLTVTPTSSTVINPFVNITNTTATSGTLTVTLESTNANGTCASVTYSINVDVLGASDPSCACDLIVNVDYNNVTCQDFGGTLLPTLPFTQIGGIGTVWIDQDGNTTFDADDIDITAGINLGVPESDLTFTVYDSGNTECAVEVFVPAGCYSCDGLAVNDTPNPVCSNFILTADEASFNCVAGGVAIPLELQSCDGADVSFSIDPPGSGAVTGSGTDADPYIVTLTQPSAGTCPVTITATDNQPGVIATSEILEIISPASIAGGVINVGGNVLTDWGIDINGVDPCVGGILVQPNDGTDPITDFCEPGTPPTPPTAAQCNGIAGNIAIIDRGNCNFTVKAENAQACGATAVIICNNDTANPDQILNMSGTTVNPVTIPTISLSYNQCQLIYAEMANGDVEVCIGAPTDLPTCETSVEVDPCALFCGIAGCTDNTACNFNPDATQNDGSCIYESTCDADPCTNGGIFVWSDVDCACVLDVATALGCTDNTACNFDPTANCPDNATCIYEEACNSDCLLGDITVWDTGTCACVVQTVSVVGCTNPNAPNFEPGANCDDGSCECVPDGCTDSNACNFDPDATCNDPSSCIYETTCDTDGCTNGGIYEWNATTCACQLIELTAEGCTQASACNFDPAANCDDGSCIFETVCDNDPCTNGGIFVWSDVDCACVLSEATVEGCGDTGACNYDPNANCFDLALCIYETACNNDCTLGDPEVWDPVNCACVPATDVIVGCTDNTACNFEPTATCDDGTCITNPGCDMDPCTNGGIYVWSPADCDCILDEATATGCTDNTACNFDPDANCADPAACIFETACNTDCTNGDPEEWDPATCACVPVGTSIPGCTDPNACNYDMDANCDDNSCITDTGCDTDPCTNGGIYVWNDVDCQCVLDIATIEGCTDNAACNFDPTANCDNGCIFETACNTDCLAGDLEEWDTDACACVVTSVSIPGCQDANATNYDPDANCSDPSSCIFDIEGCPDANAANFNPDATTDDGSCVYEGCTDANAPNYNPIATIDDGSCLPANPAGCAIDFVVNDISQGNTGGISPFYYNTSEVIVSGGTPPYNYNWDAVGYVRNAIMSSGVVKVIYDDNATWCVTVTDSQGCMVVVCEDIFNGSGMGTTTIDIVDSDITPAVLGAGGEINISVGGGTQPYTYQWSNGTTSQDLYGVSNGWYSVTVCDADNMCTEQWFWVPLSRASGRGKDALTEVNVYPNPLEATATIDFIAATSGKLDLNLYTLDGAKVIDVYEGNVEAGVPNSLKFEAGPIPAGVYILEMYTPNGEREYTKLVITK